ncbi:biotin-dependent carboxyltransferase family protein [Helicobacter ailurogastricus]|uniref:Allophanate hydrolase 2 subunit 2 n=1 Tax=Helicobacter ailurogastricus TaxID=1578720 RepID=A0A0K2XBQ1_9HELI|nr:biotin-dependent carboxyltransferase family protein [Helicobacter ailurogastricus]GMB90050.1 biotin-dependent carboxyltransferase family protein [Helicobacter ailurogastricus]CRF41515.1 Allophanate hydrolase 2 subunit 2 [Helicobacter ailurogastricus]CRF42983.1 Allophanate hydrolase 2 subunit 2 [Helicobacter ailurogastricus]CRF43712.1 Allophanate hydrolase 2 subunit 2 [Helicobacter ailurogastricus]
MSSVRVLEAGLCTSIQDLGRRGYQEFGIPVSGVMDEFSASVANFLVGNERGQALLEMTYTGGALEFLEPMQIALTGAHLSPKLNGEEIFNWESYAVKAGDILQFGQLLSGARAYLAFSGNLGVPLVHGSKSTYMRAGIGGFCGRALQKGDELLIQTHPAQKKRHLPEKHRPIYHKQASLPALLGPEAHYFSLKSVRRFFASAYKISPRADRMGICLEGEPLERLLQTELVSNPLVLGSVQVPSSGQPIVLMADRQTLGGYPKIATLLKESVIALAQMLPGQVVRFIPLRLEQAQKRYCAFYKNLAHLQEILK